MTSAATVTLNPAVDKSTHVGQVIPERKLRCAAPHFDPGGGGINVARAIRKLGGEATAIYLGGGPTGQLLGRLLDEERIERRVLPTDGWTRENLIVVEDNSNRQFRFGMPGPTVSPAEWQALLDEVASLSPPPAYLVASGSVPPGLPADVYAHLGRTSRELGSRLVLDTSGEPLRLALEEGVYLVKPNIRELAELVGQPIESEAHLETAAATLVAAGACEVVLTSLGAGGALLTSATGSYRVRSPTVPIRSKVGAGDSTVGGLVLGLLRGLSLQQAARFGVAAGSAAVMNPGTALCTREDTERLFGSIEQELMTSGGPTGVNLDT